MANRSRTVALQVYVTPEEHEKIKNIMSGAGINNFSAYARAMLLNDRVVRKDFTELKSLTGQIGKIGSNVNQIAKRANERKVVPQEDIDQVMLCLKQVLRILEREVRRVLRSEG